MRRFEREQPAWNGESRYEVAFGDLLVVHPDGRAQALTPEEDEAPRPVGGPPLGPDAEFVPVDRWLVARSGSGIHAIAAPLVRSTHLRNGVPRLNGEFPPSLATVELLRQERQQRVRTRLGSIARLGRYLAVIVGHGTRVELRIVDLNSTNGQSWEAGHSVVDTHVLGHGVWRFERGASTSPTCLVAASGREVVVVRLLSEDRLDHCRYQLPTDGGDLLPGRVAVARFGVVGLTRSPGGHEERAYLLSFAEGVQKTLRIEAEQVDGLEFVRTGTAVELAARTLNGLHKLNHLVPRFELAPRPGSMVNRVEEEMPAGVLVRTHGFQRLGIRSHDGFPTVPASVPVGSSLRAVAEGPRLWLIARKPHHGAQVSAYDWTHAS